MAIRRGSPRRSGKLKARHSVLSRSGGKSCIQEPEKSTLQLSRLKAGWKPRSRLHTCLGLARDVCDLLIDLQRASPPVVPPEREARVSAVHGACDPVQVSTFAAAAPADREACSFLYRAGIQTYMRDMVPGQAPCQPFASNACSAIPPSPRLHVHTPCFPVAWSRPLPTRRKPSGGSVECCMYDCVAVCLYIAVYAVDTAACITYVSTYIRLPIRHTSPELSTLRECAGQPALLIAYFEGARLRMRSLRPGQ